MIALETFRLHGIGHVLRLVCLLLKVSNLNASSFIYFIAANAAEIYKVDLTVYFSARNTIKTTLRLFEKTLAVFTGFISNYKAERPVRIT